MSISYRILNSKLKIESVISTLISVGVEIEYVDKGDGYDFYVIGNDHYGYTRMYVENNLVTEFERFGIGKDPIAMLFSCFSFIAYDTNDHNCDEFDNDLENMPASEFFKKHYPFEYEMRVNLKDVESYVEQDNPDLFSYIKSIDRTVASYRYELAHVKQVPVTEVQVDDVVSYMYQEVVAREKRGDI